MLFNSINFFIFFVVVLLISATLRRFSTRLEILFLIAASTYFYGQWNWTYLILIYTTIFVDFFLGIKCYESNNPKKFLFISLLTNLGILSFFKYSNFLINSTNEIIGAVGSNYQLQMFELLLPVGISFYTFQSLSYTIDIYRQQLKPRKKISEYALFVSFFPQLVAGPIVRASEFFEQLNGKRHFSFIMAQSGLLLIAIGLVKKVVFADNLALVADPVFNDPQNHGAWATLIAIYAFSFQIYFDFSGYTDIAIGVAKLLGFTFPKNFNHPYVATSIQDFWRRWHITLSRWLRDYLYISLGGNRKGTLLTTRNLFLTMFLGGLWHGSSWNFAVWGVLHGVYLGIERWIQYINIFKWDNTRMITRLFKWLITFHLVCFAWIFFRAQDFSKSTQILLNLSNFKSIGIDNIDYFQTTAVLTLPLIHWLGSKLKLAERSGSMATKEYIFWQTGLMVILFLFSAKRAESFIYFQF